MIKQRFKPQFTQRNQPISVIHLGNYRNNAIFVCIALLYLSIIAHDTMWSHITMVQFPLISYWHLGVTCWVFWQFIYVLCSICANTDQCIISCWKMNIVILYKISKYCIYPKHTIHWNRRLNEISVTLVHNFIWLFILVFSTRAWCLCRILAGYV